MAVARFIMRIIDIMFYMSAYLVGTAISHYNRDRIDTVIAAAAYTHGGPSFKTGTQLCQ